MSLEREIWEAQSTTIFHPSLTNNSVERHAIRLKILSELFHYRSNMCWKIHAIWTHLGWYWFLSGGGASYKRKRIVINSNQDQAGYAEF
jgi:hypothetical protein